MCHLLGVTVILSVSPCRKLESMFVFNAVVALSKSRSLECDLKDLVLCRPPFRCCFVMPYSESWCKKTTDYSSSTRFISRTQHRFRPLLLDPFAFIDTCVSRAVLFVKSEKELFIVQSRSIQDAARSVRSPDRNS